jgi:RNA polymerase sigma-70 factor (ECF subfamily)
VPLENLHNESMLVNAMQTGDEEAFTTLYKYYSPQLYMNILHLVHDPLSAEEIVQELFTRIWQKRDSKGIKENYTGYMYRIAQNLVHDFFRKVKHDHELKQRFHLIIEKEYEYIEEAFEMKEASAILEKAIDQLSPQQKKVYKLVRIEGYTYRKAAEIMNISPLTVKEYLVTTKKSIQNYLLNNMDQSIELLIFIFICKIVN